MIETHAFGNFVPKNAKYLILGSFIAKKESDAYDFFYSNGRNQFWSIIEAVYENKLVNKKDKQKFLTDQLIAMADIIYQCERKLGNNSDNNLVNIIYNIEAVREILENNEIKKIYFTSCFVENKFKRYFKNLIEKFSPVELITLPSPSPRYAAMSWSEKVRRYKSVFPKFVYS